MSIVTGRLAENRTRLVQAAAALRTALGEAQVNGLLELLAQLAKWNKTYNLTALRDTEQALVHHIFDSLAVVAPLRAWMVSQHRETARLLDVGSGGGLPGIVIAIAMPEVQVICIDAVEKKTTFIRQMAGVLGLNNLSALHARVEQADPLGCDLVISRAFSSLEDFAGLSAHHLASGGRIVAMKGKPPTQEIEALEAHGEWKVLEIQSLTVPELQAQRCLVWIQRRETL